MSYSSNILIAPNDVFVKQKLTWLKSWNSVWLQNYKISFHVYIDDSIAKWLPSLFSDSNGNNIDWKKFFLIFVLLKGFNIIVLGNKAFFYNPFANLNCLCNLNWHSFVEEHSLTILYHPEKRYITTAILMNFHVLVEDLLGPIILDKHSPVTFINFSSDGHIILPRFWMSNQYFIQGT